MQCYVQRLTEIDYNVNDPEFATICETIMDSMLAGEWHKGMFRELEGVIE